MHRHAGVLYVQGHIPPIGRMAPYHIRKIPVQGMHFKLKVIHNKLRLNI